MRPANPGPTDSPMHRERTSDREEPTVDFDRQLAMVRAVRVQLNAALLRRERTDAAAPPSAVGRLELDQVAWALALAPRRRPARQLPREVANVVPDPMASQEQLQRFAGDDIPALTAAQARREAFRLRVISVHLLDDQDGEITWIDQRLRALDRQAATAP